MMISGQGKNAENANLLLIGVGVGAAVGVALALTRRKRDRWYAAKQVSRRVAEGAGELVTAGRDVADCLKIIFTENRKAMKDATELWSQRRKLAAA